MKQGAELGQDVELGDVSIADLLQMIGDKEVTIMRQGKMIRKIMEKLGGQEENNGICDSTDMD